MHDLCFDKKKTVKEVFDNGLDNVQFRRTLLGDARELWGRIKEACRSVTLNEDKDEILLQAPD